MLKSSFVVWQAISAAPKQKKIAGPGNSKHLLGATTVSFSTHLLANFTAVEHETF